MKVTNITIEWIFVPDDIKVILLFWVIYKHRELKQQEHLKQKNSNKTTTKITKLKCRNTVEND